MGTLVINGGRKLNGSVSVHGSKNSVLPILAATILNSGTSVIHNCPRLRDVDAAIDILRFIGCQVSFEGNTLIVNSENARNYEIPDKMMREMRSSVIFMGAMLARLKKAALVAPGGCELGARPIDLHISSLESLGAKISEENGVIRCDAHKLKGTDIVLSFPSVGATENTMLAATMSAGQTRIINAAREPEIEDLQGFLVSMGAEIAGAGSSVITINGKRKLHNTEYTVIPDRICAATYLAAGAVCGGDICIENVVPEHISTVVKLLMEMGCEIQCKENAIRLSRHGKLAATRYVRTLPYPGFPTDAQPPLLAATTRADGTSLFVENIFDGRYRYVNGLIRMGADVRVEGKIAVVYGVPRLHGSEAQATDLRGGAALVIAAAAAEGKSIISEVAHIDRGYEKIEDTMSALGADVKRM